MSNTVRPLEKKLTEATAAKGSAATVQQKREEEKAVGKAKAQWGAMSEEDQAEATQAWATAECVPGSASDEEKGEAEVLAAEEDAEIGKAMTAFMKKDLKPGSVSEEDTPPKVAKAAKAKAAPPEVAVQPPPELTWRQAPTDRV